MQRLIQAKSEEARLRQQLDAEREKARQEQDMHRHALAQLREQQNVRAKADVSQRSLLCPCMRG